MTDRFTLTYRFPKIFIKTKLGDRMIRQLLNRGIAKYCDNLSRRSIICLSLQLQQIIDLLATDKSPYFAQPCPIINFSRLVEPSFSVFSFNFACGFFLADQDIHVVLQN